MFLLEQLLHSSNMPPLCSQGVLDPVPGRTAVLLHDLADPESPDDAVLNSNFEEVRTRFAPHPCLVLRINSGSSALQKVQTLYQPFVDARGPPPPPSESSSPLGNHLTEKDLDAIADVAREVIVRSAIPWMTQQLHQLDAQVSQKRKGIGNQLRYLLRKPREDFARPGTHHDDVYPLQTTEGQMRLAGDLAFHLRDYETALGFYRHVVSDFKQDKSWKHAAGAAEMIGICGYLARLPQNDWERPMEHAYEYYTKADAGRHAMRTVALHLAMVSDEKEAVGRLMKVNANLSDTGGLRSAMILEQAAQLYRKAGQHRKAAFYMVLSGHNYNKIGIKRLALYCYSTVMSTHAPKQWFHIVDHIHFTMARQAFGLGHLSNSLSHFVELLNSFVAKHRSIQADRENTYLKEFQFVVKTWLEKRSGGDEAVDLLIPAIAPEVTVLLPSDLLQHSHEIKDEFVPTMSWETLGEKLVVLSQDDRLELQWRSRQDRSVFDTLERVAAVDSEIHVELKLTNPMRVKLELHKARLGGELDGETGGVEFPHETIILAPLETKILRLRAIPRQQGLLHIQRVSWSLFDLVQCHRPLKLTGRRLRSTQEQRASCMYSVDKRLHLKVRTQVPVIRAWLEGWPTEPQLSGELRDVVLVIHGGSAVHVATSHPSFLSFDLTADGTMRKQGDIVVVDQTEEGVEGERRVPATLRACTLGRHAVRLCVLAVQDVGEARQSRQWVTLEQHITVSPSLACRVSLSPSLQTGRRIYSVTLENQSEEAVWIDSVRLSGSSTLKECVETEAHRIETGRQVHLLYHGEEEVEECVKSRDRERTLVVGWRTSVRGTIHAPVVEERSSACPLAMQLIAPDTVALSPDLTVPVTIRLRNVTEEDVHFFFIASASDFMWLGCERSETLCMPAGTSHIVSLQAYFPFAGVFNLNRFRFVISGGTATENQVAFVFPYEKLIHISST